MKLKMLLSNFLVWGSLGLQAQNTDWTGWLGPDRTGRAEGFEAPKQWPVELSLKWSIEVGSGYGSPLVVGEEVFVHSRQGEEEVSRCLNLKTGEQLWKARQGTPFKMGGGGERHGKGPKASPCYSGGLLFTMSIGGRMTAWDGKTGKVIWSRFPGKRFGQTHAHWGATNSPFVFDGRVINLFGNDERGSLMALESSTGKLIWSAAEDGTCYSSPFVAEISGVVQVVAWNHRALVGVDFKTGETLWEFSFPHKTHNQNMPTPAFYKGQILLGGENRGIHSLVPRLVGDKWSVRKSWSQKEVALDMASAIMAEGFLFGLSHYGQGRLFCLNPHNGKILWLGPPRTGPYASFLSFPGHVLTLSHQGSITFFKASPDSFQLVASYHELGSATWSAPVLLEDGVLIKDAQKLSLWSFSRSQERDPS